MRGLFVLVTFLIACGPSTRSNNDTDGTGPECETDGAHRCVGSTYQVCSGGAWATQEDCAVTCVENIGCAQCNPGMGVCKDGNVHSCDASGNVGGQTEACTGSNICDAGACVNACDNAAMNKSYTGCEYWAADLDNAVEVLDVQGGSGCGAPGAKNVTMQACGNAANDAIAGLCDPPGNTCPGGFTCKSMNVCILDAQKSPFAIVVSNPQSRAVNVTVTAATGATFSQSIAAGQVAALMPQAAPHSIPDQSVDGTGKENKAYKLVSDLPIVAYQFNPLDNVNVFSNDASLLIPRTAYDSQYYAMSFPTLDRRGGLLSSAHAYHGYVSIVAWEDNTVIEVTPTAAVRASATQPAIAANTPTQFTLAKHDVLTLQAAPPMGDLTGTKVRAVNGTTTFGVWGGHEATVFGEMTPPNNTHTSGPCCADHLEDMMFPTSTWGKEFAIARSQPRTNESDVLRIMAQKPNTTITFTPAPVGTCPTLNAGQHCQVKIAADTSIVASEPVLVGHYLQAATWANFIGNRIGTGDPSMALAVPTEQYRKDYTVLVPSQYTKSYMSISAPATGAVLVDGLPVQLTAFGNYRAARHQVNPGQHKISCPNGCGVVLYGYSTDVSYMFAGGLDLKKIVIN